MTKSKVLLVSTYLVSILILAVVTFSYNSINQGLLASFANPSKVASSPELTEKFFAKVKSGEFSSTDYAELFKSNFDLELESARVAKAVVTSNNSMRDLIISIGLLQLFLLTLFVKYNKKT